MAEAGTPSPSPRTLARLSRLVRSLASGAGQATARFPVAVVLVLVSAVLSNLLVAEAIDAGRGIERVLAALSGAAAASVAVTLGLEGRWARADLPKLVSVPAAAATWLAIWLSHPFPIYAPALLTACVLAVPLAPFLGRGTASGFWSFTLWTAVGVVLAFLSVLIFLLGVSAILEMVRYLFRVGLGSRAYTHLFTTALTLIGPLFALGRIPRPGDEHAAFQADDRLVRTVRPLFEWVSAPLVIATALVLHVYVGRILLTGEVPRGQIGWIVGVFSSLVIALRIAMDPFLSAGQPPARLFERLWAWMLLVPLALLAYALGQRITAEGLTVERYYLSLWGAAVAIVLLVQIVPRWRGDIRGLAAVPVVLLAASTFGPWGVADMVGRSQAGWIEDQFGARLKMLRDGRGGLSPNMARQLESRLFALETVEELGRVRPLLAESIASLPDWDRGDVDVSFLRGRLDLSRPGPAAQSIFLAATAKPISVAGYDLVFPAQSIDASSSSASDRLGLRFEGKRLELRWNGQDDARDLGPVLARLPFVPYRGAASSTSDAPEVDLVTEQGRHVRLRIEQVLIAAQTGVPESGRMSIVLRSAEWPLAAATSTPPPAPPATPPPASR